MPKSHNSVPRLETLNQSKQLRHETEKDFVFFHFVCLASFLQGISSSKTAAAARLRFRDQGPKAFGTNVGIGDLLEQLYYRVLQGGWFMGVGPWYLGNRSLGGVRE